MAAMVDENDPKEETSSTFSTMLDKVTFVNKIPLLARATSNDESPTPGYMYQEINKLSLASGSYCQALLDYLVDRLDKDSCHVKLKVLRILQFVVHHGHPEFRHGLRRRAQGIKEATKFSGPPDPLHGNTPYQMVRKAAQELSSQLFEVAENDTDVPKVQTPVLISTGGMGSTSGGGGRLEGFGSSPNLPPKSLGDSLVSSLRGLADRVVDYSRDPQATLEPSAEQHFGSYKPAELTTSSIAASCVTTENVSHLVGTKSRVTVPSKQVKSYRPGVAGGGWDEEDEDLEESTPELTGAKSFQSKSLSSAHSSSEPSEGPDSIKCEESCAEEQLVQDLLDCDKPIPQRAEVNTFIKKCCSLNCDKVIVILNELLLASTPTQGMRGLVCIEAFLRCDVVNLDHLAANCRPALAHWYAASHAQTRSKSRKIIRLLEKLIQNPSILKGILPDLPPVNSSTDGSTCVMNLEKAQHYLGLRMSPEEEGPMWNQLRIPFATSTSSHTEPKHVNSSLQIGSSEQTFGRNNHLSSSQSVSKDVTFNGQSDHDESWKSTFDFIQNS